MFHCGPKKHYFTIPKNFLCVKFPSPMGNLFCGFCSKIKCLNPEAMAVVNVPPFYFDDLSSNPAEIYSFCKIARNNRKRCRC